MQEVYLFVGVNILPGVFRMYALRNGETIPTGGIMLNDPRINRLPF